MLLLGGNVDADAENGAAFRLDGSCTWRLGCASFGLVCLPAWAGFGSLLLAALLGTGVSLDPTCCACFRLGSFSGIFASSP